MGLPAVYFDAEIFAPLESREDAEKALYWLLEALCHSNLAYLKARPNTPRLYDSGIRYVQDPPGREWWMGVGRVLQRGVADCKSLAAVRVAECRLHSGEDGKDPVKGLAHFELKRFETSPGRVTYHVTLRRGDGTIEDPSSILGMGAVV